MVPFNKEEDKTDINMEVITIRHNQIVHLGAVRLNCPKDLRSNDSIKVIAKSLQVRIFSTGCDIEFEVRLSVSSIF